jgi:hypothetical protein
VLFLCEKLWGHKAKGPAIDGIALWMWATDLDGIAGNEKWWKNEKKQI